MENSWIIVDASGRQFIDFKTLLSVDVKNDNRVVSSPVEQGSFASYNKVESPLEIRAALALQGDATVTQKALETLDAFARGTDLLMLVTPSAVYVDLNLESFSYLLNDLKGILVAECTLIEIRQVETAMAFTFPGVRNPTSVSRVNTGRAVVRSIPRAMVDGAKALFGVKGGGGS
jgi:hypothetical protein